jgi:hypothetical protein
MALTTYVHAAAKQPFHVAISAWELDHTMIPTSERKPHNDSMSDPFLYMLAENVPLLLS